VKKPVRLGSVSPAHKESCKDLEPFISRSPETPPLDPAKDDYHDDQCPGKTCLEEAEELARSPEAPAVGGHRAGGRGSAGGSATPSVRSPTKQPAQSPSKTSAVVPTSRPTHTTLTACSV